MKHLGTIFIALIGLAISVSQPRAQGFAYGFNCIGSHASATLGQCIDGSIGLRGYNGTTVQTYATVEGFLGQGDGGGGEFYQLGPAATYCNSSAVPAGVWATATGSTTITFSPAISQAVTIGEALGGTGIQPGAEIASISSTVPPISSITMTLPATGAASGNLLINGDNGGTLIVDNEMTPQCWQKTNYQGEPHEWGAVGDGVTDDTAALQNWLGAYGAAPSAFASGAVATNFGPWIATIPANYSVSSPLSCPQNANIQGQANSSTSTGSPAVRIFAAAGFNAGTPAPLLTINANCRLTGIAIDANNQAGVDAIDVDGTNAVIDGHSLVANAGSSATTADDVLCAGPGAPSGAPTGELRIENSQIVDATNDNIHLATTCPDVHLNGDLILGAAGNGVYSAVSDLTIADGSIEKSQQYGLDLDAAYYVSVSTNDIDMNGESAAGNYQAVQINNSLHVSICGNNLWSNGEGVAGGSGDYTSHIYVSGTNDNVSLCGNAYAADDLPIGIGFTPQYVYDASSSTILTNSGLYENPGNQGVGVFTQRAAALLPPVKAPHVPAGFISGLTMSNDSMNAHAVDIAPGEASDSTGSASIVLTQPCQVNLSTTVANGLHGLDVGSVALGQTYFFYVVANPGGGNPSCIASTSANGPAFTAVTGAGFLLSTTGVTNTAFSNSTIFNVGSIAGAAPNNAVTATSAGSTVASSTISAFSNAYPATSTLSPVTWVAGTSYMTYPSTVIPPGIYPGMQIADEPSPSGPSCLPNNTYITSMTIMGSSSTQINLSSGFPAYCPTSGGSADLSLGQQIVVQILGVTGTTMSVPASVVINAGIYRLVGALYTSGTSANIVKFTQDADTFYLSNSVEDITPTLCPISGLMASICKLSVPCGLHATCASGQDIQVEAFGRVVGGTTNQIILSSLDQSDQPPTTFTAGAPGYTSQSSAANTGAPFRLYTSLISGSTPGAVRLRASASGVGSTPAFEVTDGWVFHR